VTDPLRLWLPLLPSRALNSNARVHYMEKADAESELRADVTGMVARDPQVQALPQPAFQRARVSIAWHMTNRKPKVTECPRCLAWALEHQRSNRQECRCYRPRDGWNAAIACKGVVDGMTDAGLWRDDVFEVVSVGEVTKVTVATLEEEGLMVTIEAVE